MHLSSDGEAVGDPTCQWGLNSASTLPELVMNSSFFTGGPLRMSSTEAATPASGS